MAVRPSADGEPLDGPSLLAQAASEPTLDELMRREPQHLTEEDRKLIVQYQRADRARWHLAKEERKAKKKDAEEDEEC